MSTGKIEWRSLGQTGGRKIDWRSAGTVGFIAAGIVASTGIEAKVWWWIPLFLVLAFASRYFLDLHDRKVAALVRPEEAEE